MLFNLDREALSPLFVYCDAMERFIESLYKAKPLDSNGALPSPTKAIESSPRLRKPGVATMPLPASLPPTKPKRFIELPKQEQHVLHVAFYLKDVLTKLSGGACAKPAGKFQSHRKPMDASLPVAADALPLDLARELRAIKTKLRKNEFFADLPNLIADAATKVGDSRQANTHQAFSSFFLCLHEVVRSTSYHSIELADGAFDLLGEVLRAIQDYIVEVVGQRKTRRSRIRVLRAQRQQLRAQFGTMEAETQGIAQEAIKLSTVLSAIELELNVLRDECDWHAHNKRLFLDTIRALRNACDQPPLVFVNADGVSKVLQPGTAILRVENIPHIRYLVQLLALSRSFAHVRLNDPRVNEANPARKLSMSKLNHQGRAETLKMHLMNQRPRDHGDAMANNSPPPHVSDASTGADKGANAPSALHKNADSGHGHGASSRSNDGPICLVREVAKLPEPWRSAFPSIHEDELVTLLSKDDMLHDVSSIYAAYDDMLVRPSHTDDTTPTISFPAFVTSYYLVHPRNAIMDPTPSNQSSTEFHARRVVVWKLSVLCVVADETRHGPAWASLECARLLVSIHSHVQGAVSLDWLGYFAVFTGLSKTLTLPLPRALDAFLVARRMLLATTVMRQRHADPTTVDVIWVMAKDITLPSAAYTLHGTAVKILSSFTRSPATRERVLDRVSDLKNTTQVNLTMVHTCIERQHKFERLLAMASAADCDDVAAAVERAWFAYHFLQQDIHATTHAILKQQKIHKVKRTIGADCELQHAR
ncbi:hypothetical protein DYB32_002148 [Aphanomyces invadans]|uniref:Uncharacterized protein n=1 Tax=Aphanomyces invadans TaxID=157072 RepID=A0A3R7AD29_9STRA|nr:hypothetical protein DYB32_002148 [Aphanomyces invadans]